MTRTWLVVVCILVAAVASMLAQQQRDLLLVAQEPVPVYTSEAASTVVAGASQRTLRVSEKVEVIQCIDVKHYLIYKVRLSDGSVGFINEGKYVLESADSGKEVHCRL